MRLTAAAVAAVALASPAAADQTNVSYNVAPGTCKYPITVPIDNKPTFLVTLSTAANGDPTMQMQEITLIRRPAHDPVFTWIVPGSQTQYGSEVGRVILGLDRYTFLNIGPSELLRVCNAKTNPESATGTLTFIY
jgi:hypothetical protein